MVHCLNVGSWTRQFVSVHALVANLAEVVKLAQPASCASRDVEAAMVVGLVCPVILVCQTLQTRTSDVTVLLSREGFLEVEVLAVVAGYPLPHLDWWQRRLLIG